MDDDTDWYEELSDDPDFRAMSAGEKARIVRLIERTLELGIAGIYGDEDPGVPDADFPCERYTDRCKAKCCTFIFALTPQEVEQGLIAYNQERPFFIARDADGYCPHLDRATYRCTVWESRPLRCRRYECSEDPEVWPEGLPSAD